MGGERRERSLRLARLALTIVGEVLLLGALAWAAWAPNDNGSYPPLSLGDGLQALVLIGGLGSVFVVAGAVAMVRGRRIVGQVAGAVLLVMAGVIGFLGTVLTAFSRCQTCDDA